MSSLRRDTFVNATSNILLAVLAVVSGSLISYRYGAGGRGTLGIAQVISAFCAGLGSMGLGDALLHYAASRRDVNRRMVASVAIGASLVSMLLGSLVAMIVASRLDTSVRAFDFVAFVGLTSGATAAYTVASGAVRGFGRFAAWNALRLLATIAWTASLLLLSAGTSTLRPLALGVVYGTALTLITIGAVVAVGSMAAMPHAGLARVPVSELLRFGLPSALASTPLLLNARIDQVAVGLAHPTAVAGQYVAAAGYCWATVPFGQAIANLTATRVATNPDRAGRIAAVKDLSSLGITVIGASGLLAWAMAPHAIRLLNGPGFDQAVDIARILLIGTTFQAITHLLEEGARGLGRPGFAMQAELIGLSVLVILLVAVTRGGVLPVAWVSTFGYFVSFAVITHLIAKFSKTSRRSLLRPAGPARIRLLVRGSDT